MLANNSGLIAMHEPHKSDDISCKNTFSVLEGVAKYSRIIPGSECLNKLAIARSDIRIRPRLSILNT